MCQVPYLSTLMKENRGEDGSMVRPRQMYAAGCSTRKCLMKSGNCTETIQCSEGIGV